MVGKRKPKFLISLRWMWSYDYRTERKRCSHLSKKTQRKRNLSSRNQRRRIMPVPEGDITTSEILSTDEVVELAPDEEEDQS